jgi:hypothetical protein
MQALRPAPEFFLSPKRNQKPSRQSSKLTISTIKCIPEAAELPLVGPKGLVLASRDTLNTSDNQFDSSLGNSHGCWANRPAL